MSGQDDRAIRGMIEQNQEEAPTYEFLEGLLERMGQKMMFYTILVGYLLARLEATSPDAAVELTEMDQKRLMGVPFAMGRTHGIGCPTVEKVKEGMVEGETKTVRTTEETAEREDRRCTCDPNRPIQFFIEIDREYAENLKNREAERLVRIVEARQEKWRREHGGLVDGQGRPIGVRG